MSDVKTINDADLEQVSGGAGQFGTYKIDKAGNVAFTDKDGKDLSIAKADWEWLKTQYNDPNAEQFIKEVPAKDITEILAKHHQA